MDLAVDEQGLWALWGDTDNSYRLYAYKIDVYKNAVTDTYTLATGKTTISNEFQFLSYMFQGTLKLHSLFATMGQKAGIMTFLAQ